MKLQEWAVIFLKHQDLFKREIKEIVEEPGKIVVQKRKDELWLVQEDVDFSQDAHGIICLNTKQNFKSLLAAWSSLKNSDTRIVFANPRTNERWAVVPAHHCRVVDKPKQGLEALFASITEY